jgi:hypothetical protein
LRTARLVPIVPRAIVINLEIGYMLVKRVQLHELDTRGTYKVNIVKSAGRGDATRFVFSQLSILINLCRLAFSLCSSLFFLYYFSTEFRLSIMQDHFFHPDCYTIQQCSRVQRSRPELNCLQNHCCETLTYPGLVRRLVFLLEFSRCHL